MKLYNTLTRKKESIKPIDSNTTTVYTCGPTVYDYPHVGNWFTFIRYDLLIRILKMSGNNPIWVMNITDVGHLVSDADEGEDKLEKGAQREGKTAWDVAEFYSNYFITGLQRLNILTPTHLPKATEHIPEQIALIKSLEAKGYTYIIDDGVYYDTSKFADYAAFAQLKLDDIQAGARVEHNHQKRNPSDFALWKLSPQGKKRDMEWDSPWGIGFPGWHLECSAMAMKYLGETIDIHSGGIDHIPVHHTNEIAQSEAATGKPFANYWMHTNHITVNDEKISKSLGNSITLEDIENKGHTLQALRLHVLESHYRSQSKFSWEALTAANNRLQRYRAMAQQMWQTSNEGKVTSEAIMATRSSVETLLKDDLNTPQALAILSELENNIDSNGLHASAKDDFSKFLTWIDTALGLTLHTEEDITTEQRNVIQQREAARAQKDWQASDSLRDKLLQEGILVKDTPIGTIWNRTK